MPLRSQDGKLLLVDNKLAASDDCCCGGCLCPAQVTMLQGLISNIHAEWDFVYDDGGCSATIHVEGDWTITTDPYPPAAGTFLFRCSPFTNLPEFVAGSIDPIIGYVFGDGIRMKQDLPDWLTADIDINQNDCESFTITPGFTIGYTVCGHSPFASGSTITVNFTDLIGTRTLTITGLNYTATFTLVIS